MIEKHEQARAIVKRYALYSAGAGLIPVLFLDGAVVAGVQLKMLAELSKVYGVPFRENLGKAAIAAAAGFIIPHAGALGALSGAATGLCVLGAPLAAAFAAAYSWAMGQMFIQHFESGGTFLNFKPEAIRQYFRTQFEKVQAPAPAPAADGGSVAQ
jgi:uncharacterized protein (DUF697 family)